MRINAEFDKRAVVHSERLEWVDSPMPGVQRRPLDRVGIEVARATSIVRYAPKSHFSAHEHTGGEEFFVLEGVFQDEHGDFPAGCYIRNPPGSSHTPGSELGCVIFVKLWQFKPDDKTHVRLNSNFLQPVPMRNHTGVCVTPLYHDRNEDVKIEYWEANTEVQYKLTGGAEILVLEGSFSDGLDTFEQYAWLRLPLGSTLHARAGDTPTKVLVKRGHLVGVMDEISRLPI